MFQRSIKIGIGGLFLAGAVVCFLTVMRLTAPLPAPGTPLPDGQPVDWYKRAVSDAMSQTPPDIDRLEAATARLLALTPDDPDVWHQIALSDLARNRQLTRTGLAALYKAYGLSPYGGLDQMIWRVDFGTTIWTSLPPDLQAQTVAQLDVIARFGATWDWRARQCRDNPHEDIWRPACATVPGVVRPGTRPSLR